MKVGYNITIHQHVSWVHCCFSLSGITCSWIRSKSLIDESSITSPVRWAMTFPTKTSPPARRIQEGHVSHLHIHLPVGIFTHCSVVCVFWAFGYCSKCKGHMTVLSLFSLSFYNAWWPWPWPFISWAQNSTRIRSPVVSLSVLCDGSYRLIASGSFQFNSERILKIGQYLPKLCIMNMHVVLFIHDVHNCSSVRSDMYSVPDI